MPAFYHNRPGVKAVYSGGQWVTNDHTEQHAIPVCPKCGEPTINDACDLCIRMAAQERRFAREERQAAKEEE